MDKIFSLRLDHETNRKLAALAKHSLRSRASVLRMLIHQAEVNQNLLDPQLEGIDHQKSKDESHNHSRSKYQSSL